MQPRKTATPTRETRGKGLATAAGKGDLAAAAGKEPCAGMSRQSLAATEAPATEVFD